MGFSAYDMVRPGIEEPLAGTDSFRKIVVLAKTSLTFFMHRTLMPKMRALSAHSKKNEPI